MTPAFFTILLALTDPVPWLPSQAECQRRAELACLELEAWRRLHRVGGGWALEQRVVEAETWARFWILAASAKTRDNPLRFEAASKLNHR